MAVGRGDVRRFAEGTARNQKQQGQVGAADSTRHRVAQTRNPNPATATERRKRFGQLEPNFSLNLDWKTRPLFTYLARVAVTAKRKR